VKQVSMTVTDWASAAMGDRSAWRSPDAAIACFIRKNKLFLAVRSIAPQRWPLPLLECSSPQRCVARICLNDGQSVKRLTDFDRANRDSDSQHFSGTDDPQNWRRNISKGALAGQPEQQLEKQ
jgi:hypothetical protein